MTEDDPRVATPLPLGPPPQAPPPPRRDRSLPTRVAHYAEYLGMRLASAITAPFSYERATMAVGGILGWLGPRVPSNRRAERNLVAALPMLSVAERAAIIRDVWRNLGALAVDYSRLPTLRADATRTPFRDPARLAAIIQRGGPVIFVSGHLACWEAARIAITRAGLPVSMVYRAFNNPPFDRHAWRLMWMPNTYILHKGAQGAKDMLKLLSAGGAVMILADQRLSTGVEVPFFGMPARTAPAIADLALKFDAPVVPVRAVRTGPGRFEIDFGADIAVPREGAKAERVKAILTEINAVLESWIRERPAEWFWLHKRWAPEVLAARRATFDQPK